MSSDVHDMMKIGELDPRALFSTPTLPNAAAAEKKLIAATPPQSKSPGAPPPKE